MKILFLLKKTSTYDGYSAGTVPKAGLYNSARFVAEQLNSIPGLETKLEVCVDSNSIDREVSLYKPDVCVLEAIWVTPEKMDVLIDLHPTVEFVIRIHSKIPFLANEGMALQRIKAFDNQDLTVSFNDKNTSRDFFDIDIFNSYLPNIYRAFPFEPMSCGQWVKLIGRMALSGSQPLRKYFKRNELHVGCFGAVRPMKNQLLQAVAALAFARENGLVLHFHINGTRIEQGGDSAYKNLKALFEDEDDAYLVEHQWLPHNEFLVLIGSMDIGLQVSFSESFNIISADFASKGVPIIVSEEVAWMPKICKVRETSLADIKGRLMVALKNRELFAESAKRALVDYNKRAIKEWTDFLI